jgi:hypothetical protein
VPTREHPHPRQVGNRQQCGRGIDRGANRDAAIHDHAAPWRNHCDEPLRFVRLFDRRDFIWGHSQNAKPRLAACDDAARDTRRCRVSSCRQVLRLRGQQLLGEEVCERLAGPNLLSGGVDVQMLDPARHACMHVRDSRFVRHNGRYRSHGLRQQLPPDGFESNIKRSRGGSIDRNPIVRVPSGRPPTRPWTAARFSESRRFHARHAVGSCRVHGPIEGPSRSRVLNPQPGREDERGCDRRCERRADALERGKEFHWTTASYDPMARPSRAQERPSCVSAAMRSD